MFYNIIIGPAVVGTMYYINLDDSTEVVFRSESYARMYVRRMCNHVFTPEQHTWKNLIKVKVKLSSSCYLNNT